MMGIPISWSFRQNSFMPTILEAEGTCMIMHGVSALLTGAIDFIEKAAKFNGKTLSPHDFKPCKTTVRVIFRIIFSTRADLERFVSTLPQ